MRELFRKASLATIILSDSASYAQESKNEIGDIINNKGIITQGQHGDNFIIKEEPARVEYYGRTKQAVGEGKFSFLWKIRVTKPVNRLFVQARGSNVESIEISREGPTSALTDVEYQSFKDEAGVVVREESFSNAHGVYFVNIITTSEVPPRIASKI